MIIFISGDTFNFPQTCFAFFDIQNISSGHNMGDFLKALKQSGWLEKELDFIPKVRLLEVKHSSKKREQD